MKREGSGGSSSSLDGTIRIAASTAADGSLVIHARGVDGTLDGELSFALCN